MKTEGRKFRIALVLYWISLAVIASGAYLSIFGGHAIGGFLIYAIGFSIHGLTVHSFSGSEALTVIFACLSAALGVLGLIYGENYWYLLYGILTTFALIITVSV